MPVLQRLEEDKVTPLKKDDWVDQEILTRDQEEFSQLLQTVIEQHQPLISLARKNKSIDTLKKEIAHIVDQHYSYGQEKVKIRLWDYLMGYDVLQTCIEDESISNINFTRHDYCIMDRKGQLKVEPIRFPDEDSFRMFAMLMVTRLGGKIDENNAYCRESDEKYRLRISVTIPPRNRTGTSMFIRKHRMRPYSLEDLKGEGMMNAHQFDFLKELAERFEDNFLICGAGSSGKTTLLRAMCLKMDPMKIIMLLEKDVELFVDEKKNIVSQRIKKEGTGGKKETLRDILKDGLTMNLYGYIIGEMVGEEAIDLLFAGCTNHKVASTLHLEKDENIGGRILLGLEKDGGTMSEEFIQRMLERSIRYLIHLDHFKIDRISEIVGYDRKSQKLIFKNLSSLD